MSNNGATPDTSTASLFGCLLDVSGSMRDALEPGRPEEPAVDRLRAVLRAAIKLAQTAQARDPQARMFVGAFGLRVEARCPPVVDLCSVVSALLDTHGDGRTGHELLIELANQNNLPHVTKYIRMKLSDDEARIVHAHLQRHPHRILEFVNAIPKTDRIQGARNTARRFVGGPLSIPGLPLLARFSPSAAGAVADAATAGMESVGNRTANILEDQAVEHSEALKLARSIWEEWWKDFAKLVARPVDDVVQLLKRLEEHPATNSGSIGSGASSEGRLLDTLHRYMYGHTPMREALHSSWATFLQHPRAEQRVLVLISDGGSTDGDPLPYARRLQRANISIAAVYLTPDRAVPQRQLHYEAAEGWNVGQRSLIDMAARVPWHTHPIPALASLGWEVPSSGECALYAEACSAEILEEFCAFLLSARFGSADGFLDVLARIKHDEYIHDEHMRTRNNPRNQRDSETCYAHAIAGVLHMALNRIAGREAGYPTIREIRTRILQEFPSKPGVGQDVEKVLKKAIAWYPPLRFRKVGEQGAREAVVRRRPVLTTFRLSNEGWRKFCEYFHQRANTAKSVLTRSTMEPYRSSKDGGGHAVIMVSCGPRSLTFLNSWGRNWGDAGSFSVQDYTVLQRSSWFVSSPVCFYDVYWLDSDLTEREQQAFSDKADELLRARAEQVPGIFNLEARCPLCRADSPIARFRGNIRRAACPACHQSFAPEPGHLMQALYARAGLSDLA